MYTYSSFKSLHGDRLRLEKMTSDDVAEAARVLFSPTTWVVAHRNIETPEKLIPYLRNFVEKDRAGESLTLVARVNATNEVAALSRYHNAGPEFFKVEIGATWIADRWMRTFVNTEMKKLMLAYAFETMNVRRVEFCVDPENDKSNKAMKRLGATLEGTLRKWRFLSPDDKGSRSIYAILDDEWPRVRAHLENLQKRHAT